MTNWANLLVAAFILAGYAVFMWKVWPIIKENAIVKRAAEIVYQMEEMYGAGTGPIKLEKAIAAMQEWLNRRGWKLDVQVIIDIVTAAVGALHAEQGKAPAVHEKVTEQQLTIEDIGAD